MNARQAGCGKCRPPTGATRPKKRGPKGPLRLLDFSRLCSGPCYVSAPIVKAHQSSVMSGTASAVFWNVRLETDARPASVSESPDCVGYVPRFAMLRIHHDVLTFCAIVIRTGQHLGGIPPKFSSTGRSHYWLWVLFRADRGSFQRAGCSVGPEQEQGRAPSWRRQEPLSQGRSAFRQGALRLRPYVGALAFAVQVYPRKT